MSILFFARVLVEAAEAEEVGLGQSVQKARFDTSGHGWQSCRSIIRRLWAAQEISLETRRQTSGSSRVATISPL